MTCSPLLPLLSLFYFPLLTVVIFIASGGIAGGGQRWNLVIFIARGWRRPTRRGGMEVLYLVIYITRVYITSEGGGDGYTTVMFITSGRGEGKVSIYFIFSSL
jgi:hypothetical protein